MVQAQRRIHFTMAFIGRFLGVYTILRFAGLFGSAQTANLIYLVTDLLGGSWTDMLLRLGGAALYMAGIALTVWLPLGPVRDLRRLSVGIDMAAAILVALLPAEISPVLGLYPLFFAMAVQWNSFPGADGFVSSSIFSTNNLRQFTMALANTSAGNNQRPKAAFFGKTLLSFHCGVGMSFLCWRALGLRSVLLALAPCALAMAQLFLEPQAAVSAK